MNVKVDQIKLAMTGKLTTYQGLLDYRYKCLCVKTSNEALLPIEVNIGDVDVPLEKVATAAVIDDEHFVVAPNTQDLVLPVCEAFMKTYPQLKQDVINPLENPYSKEETRNQIKGMMMLYKQQTGEYLTLPENIILTTPEVNDYMKDVLNKSVDSLKQQCEVLYQKELNSKRAELAKALFNDSPEELKKGNDALDEEYDKCWKEVERATQEEKDAIEEANKRYHQRKDEKEKVVSESTLSPEDDKVVHSMKLGGSYEE